MLVYPQFVELDSRCFVFINWVLVSLLAEVSHDEAKMRERRKSLSFLSFLPRRERPLLAGKVLVKCRQPAKKKLVALRSEPSTFGGMDKVR